MSVLSLPLIPLGVNVCVCPHLDTTYLEYRQAGPMRKAPLLLLPVGLGLP